jgi:hypothetical protein
MRGGSQVGRFQVISLQRLSGIRGSEPAYVTRLVSEHDQPHIRSPFATAAPTSRLRRAGLRKTRTFLENGVSGHGLLRFVHLDPSGLITSRGLRYRMMCSSRPIVRRA